jgi:hypothetical protein
LGIGNNGLRNVPVQVLGLTVASLSAGGDHSLAVSTLLPPMFSPGNLNRTIDGQQLTLQLTGSPNYPYILQTTTDMTPPVNWQSVLTNPADGNGNWSFTVTNLPSPGGYFRAVAQ